MSPVCTAGAGKGAKSDSPFGFVGLTEGRRHEGVVPVERQDQSRLMLHSADLHTFRSSALAVRTSPNRLSDLAPSPCPGGGRERAGGESGGEVEAALQGRRRTGTNALDSRLRGKDGCQASVTAR